MLATGWVANGHGVSRPLRLRAHINGIDSGCRTQYSRVPLNYHPF
jgi:hypothetical protein